MSITSIPNLIPWYPCNIPIQIQSELTRREGDNRGLNYVNANNGDWGNTTGNWSKYRGPQTPWIRVTSNGQGMETGVNANKPGFILASPSDFFSTYGFSRTSGYNESIIGFQPNSSFTPHTLINNNRTSTYPIQVPSPQIESINIIIQHELYRKATINWVCFSRAQLEYMTPYFLVPSITFVLEWGWNNFNPMNLIDVTSVPNLNTLFRDPYPLYTQNILGSNGNYDVMLGTVSNFNWSVEGTTIKCMTEISSRDRMYSGLIINSTTEDVPVDSDGKDTTSNTSNAKLPFGSLIDFVDERIDLLKSVIDKNSNLHKGTPETSDEVFLNKFIKYLKQKHEDNWKEYLYGIFYGRDINSENNLINTFVHREDDFDITSPLANTWINLGLIIEIFNYCNVDYSTISGGEFFRIDIDDILITGHKNMISSDGGILLIPNTFAPKYFYGQDAQATNNISNDDITQLSICSNFIKPQNEDAADKRLYHVCIQLGGTYRDNLDELINSGRYNNGVSPVDSICEFPTVRTGTFENGYLKNLYVNVNFLKKLVHDDGIITYTDLIDKMMSSISSACGNFWDFRLVSSTGNPVPDGNQSTMKIIDTKYIPDNVGTPFIFEYMTDNSILTGMEFKPTISSGQAIRSLYAATNIRKNADTKSNNGTNELLDYMFRDRLFLDDSIKNSNDVKNDKPKNDGITLMKDLQTLSATPEMFQLTTVSDDKTIIRRLVLPASDVVNMLMDDGDYDNNPTYVGIMPGIQATFTIQGIGGLRTFMMFLVRGLPEPYSETNIIFRITNITENIEAGKWTTTITAGVIPLRNGVRTKIGLLPV